MGAVYQLTSVRNLSHLFKLSQFRFAYLERKFLLCMHGQIIMYIKFIRLWTIHLISACNLWKRGIAVQNALLCKPIPYVFWLQRFRLRWGGFKKISELHCPLPSVFISILSMTDSTSEEECRLNSTVTWKLLNFWHMGQSFLMVPKTAFKISGHLAARQWVLEVVGSWNFTGRGVSFADNVVCVVLECIATFLLLSLL